MDKRTRFVAALFLAAFTSACSDEAPPTAPEAPVRPELGVVTAPDLTGLFFYGPPVGEDQEPTVQFDPTQLSVLTFEICPESELDGTDPLVDPCENPLARWTSDGGPSGISGEIFLVRDAENDWYQLDILFSEFGESDLEIDGETMYVGRVIVGAPDAESVDAYGAFTFVLVESMAGGPNPPGGDMKVQFDRDLPVKWFLGEGASEEVLCETAECTTKVIVAEDGGELCFPDGDCGSSDATAGVSIEGGVLPHDIVLRIEDIDLGDNPNPLGIQNTIEEAVDISATPPFEDLDAFDNDGDGLADIAVQLCYFTDDPDPYATYRGTENGAERLPFDPRLNFIFDDANCEGTNSVASLLGDGVLGKVELALRTKVLRPAWRFLGPQPLRAGDKSFTADARGFSPFAPARDLDLAANEEPAPLVANGETVVISVCVEGAHPMSDAPTEQVEGAVVTFETFEAGNGTLSSGNQSGTSVEVSSSLEQPTADCVNEENPGGQVAVARASWTVPSQAGSYSARAFLDEDHLVSADNDLDGDEDNTDGDGVFELEEEVVEVTFETTSQAGIALLDIAPGDRHTCAVSSGGGGLCWGQNNFGQLGDGGTTSSTRPVAVSTSLSFGDISDWGDVQNGVDDLAHSCAVSDGDIWCWGFNGSGQLGNGTTSTDETTTPVQVIEPDQNPEDGIGDINFVSVSAGFGFTCAQDDGSRVWCWGRNTSGQLGINDENVSLSTTPVEVVSQTFFQSGVEAGSGHACALTKDGDLHCWGANGSGQVGDGTTDDVFSPVEVATGIAGMSAGETHTCAVNTSGVALCWGDNAFDQLGDGSGAGQPSPVAVQNPLELVFGQVSAGGHHTCATAFTPGDFRPVTACWGANFSGQLGDGSISPSDEPVVVAGGIEFSRVETGIFHTCGISDNGAAAYCWGGNDEGQVGNGDTGTSPRVPTPVLPPQPIIIQ